MTDGQLDHVVGARHQRNHVVEDAWPLDVGAVLKVEFFRLKVVLLQRPRQETYAVLGVGKGHVC